MLRKISKQDKILYAITTVLFVLFILSFTKTGSSADKRETIKTALVNPKYENSISKFELSDDKTSITLTKQKDYWVITQDNNTYQLPVSGEKVNRFIKSLTTVQNMYKLSDKINKNSAFGLTDNSTFHLKYYFENGFHQLYFGNQDFSMNYRYLMTDKNTIIYEIDSSIDSFLSTSVQNWSEPFIISQEVFGKLSEKDIQRAFFINDNKTSSFTDISKLLDLRHGGIPEQQKLVNADSKIILELGNKNEIELNIFETVPESEYTVKAVYKSYNSKVADQIFYSKISLWTYNKIKEITL